MTLQHVKLRDKYWPKYLYRFRLTIHLNKCMYKHGWTIFFPWVMGSLHAQRRVLQAPRTAVTKLRMRGAFKTETTLFLLH